jgi:hypothetical protein
MAQFQHCAAGGTPVMDGDLLSDYFILAERCEGATEAGRSSINPSDQRRSGGHIAGEHDRASDTLAYRDV